MKWTHPQGAFLRATHKRKLFRAGNRVGKSFAAVGDVAERALGDHRYLGKPWRRTDQWIVCVTWRQALPLMRHLRLFLPDSRIVEAPNWYASKGWGKDSPTLVLDNACTIGFRTTRQGPSAFAGDELDHILIDEPCAAEDYRELERRVISRAGSLTISMTPVNAPGGDLDWLRELVERGIIEDHHVPMTPEAFTFEDGSVRVDPEGTPYDQAWIDEQRASVLPAYAPVILDGAWDTLTVDAVLGGWRRAEHVSADMPQGDIHPDGPIKLALGCDHGSLDFAETAMLWAVDDSGTYPRVWALDEYRAPANSAPEDDAREIIALLERWNLEWSQLTCATGDIPHYGGRRNRVGRKSNAELAAEIVRELKLGSREALSPPLRQAKTGRGAGPRGSVYRGLQWIHRAMLRPGHFNVNPRCKGFIEAVENYRGGHNDPHAHLIDAARYSLDPWIRRGQFRQSGGPTLYVA